MSLTVYGPGAAHASSLIASGDYNATAAWTFSAEDGNALLGPKGDDWTNYAKFHLAEDSSESDNTKARWKYPFGKDGKVYRSGLEAAKRRAAQYGAKAVEDKADELIDELDKKDGKGDDEGAETGGPDDGNVVRFRGKMRRQGASSASTANLKIVRAASGDAAEIWIYGPIGNTWWDDTGISANQFRKELQALGKVKTIDLRLNSEGGDVFDGKAIYTLLVENDARVVVHVDGLAASAASYIAMAGNEIRMAEGAFMMIHQSATIAFGNAADLRKTIGLLEQVDATLVDVYAARSKVPADQIKKMMADETWMDGKEAIAKGFADLLVPNMKVAAAVRDPSRFRHLPAALRPNRIAAATVIERMRGGASA